MVLFEQLHDCHIAAPLGLGKDSINNDLALSNFHKLHYRIRSGLVRCCIWDNLDRGIVAVYTERRYARSIGFAGVDLRVLAAIHLTAGQDHFQGTQFRLHRLLRRVGPAQDSRSPVSAEVAVSDVQAREFLILNCRIGCEVLTGLYLVHRFQLIAIPKRQIDSQLPLRIRVSTNNEKKGLRSCVFFIVRNSLHLR